MSAVEPQSQRSIQPQKRRRHHKSRNGCVECKRRRVKCDELKPSCTRCKLALRKCIYPPAPSCACLFANTELDETLEPTPPSDSASSLSPGTSSLLERSLYSEQSSRSASVFIEEDGGSNDVEDALQSPSDTALYHHYLQHTSRTLTFSQRDQAALQIGMPTLALRSKTVFHSILAVSAACMCCDIVAKEPPPDVSAVTRILNAGYQHYNVASEGIRELIPQSDDLKAEPLLASAMLLVPFSAAVQQINHWISSRHETYELTKPLSTTPRDVIVMMRGIKTALQALALSNVDTNAEIQTPEETESAIYSPPSLEFTATQPADPPPPPGHTHIMFPILAATNRGAFSRLRERLESASPSHSHSDYEQRPDNSLSACAAALETLDAIRINIFSTSKALLAPSLDQETQYPLLPGQPASLSRHVAPWLCSFAARGAIPHPKEPLTRPLLSFLVQAPQEYIDLVVPLLDQRLERPIGTPPHIAAAPGLTQVQALALDIYAHWSVLMFLAEEESWWIGTLPVVTLTGMLNRYGDDFVSHLWPKHGSGRDDWWPESMLTILRKIKQHRIN